MYPSLILKNQFGEQSNNSVLGGSSKVNASFTVDSGNANGLGISALTQQGVPEGIAAIYMHTSQTPASGNPNPAAGYILVQFAKGYRGFVSGAFGLRTPASGTPINVTTGVTAGLVYVITSLGNTSAAQWQALGLPANLTPAVGQAFVAPATTTATGTGQIQVQKNTGSGIDHLEVVGNPNTTIPTTDSVNGTLILVALGATNSSTTTLKPVAPADGTIIDLEFNLLPTADPVE